MNCGDIGRALQRIQAENCGDHLPVESILEALHDAEYGGHLVMPDCEASELPVRSSVRDHFRTHRRAHR